MTTDLLGLRCVVFTIVSCLCQVPQYSVNYFDDGRDVKLSLSVQLPGACCCDMDMRVQMGASPAFERRARELCT